MGSVRIGSVRFDPAQFSPVQSGSVCFGSIRFVLVLFSIFFVFRFVYSSRPVIFFFIPFFLLLFLVPLAQVLELTKASTTAFTNTKCCFCVRTGQVGFLFFFFPARDHGATKGRSVRVLRSRRGRRRARSRQGEQNTSLTLTV